MEKHNEAEKEFFDFFKNNGKEVSYKKGGIIMRPEDTPSGIYYIKKGYVQVYSISENGTEKLHIIYKPDDVFSLTWALNDEQKDLYYVAIDNVSLIKIQKKDFLKFVYSNHTATLILLQKLIKMYSMFSDRINDLEVSKTYPRTISCLIFFANHYGSFLDQNNKKNTDPYIILAPITHQIIANFSAMTRETTSREMSLLEKKKIIFYKAHLIVINGMKNMKKELSKSLADS